MITIIDAGHAVTVELASSPGSQSVQVRIARPLADSVYLNLGLIESLALCKALCAIVTYAVESMPSGDSLEVTL